MLSSFFVDYKLELFGEKWIDEGGKPQYNKYSYM